MTAGRDPFLPHLSEGGTTRQEAVRGLQLGGWSWAEDLWRGAPYQLRENEASFGHIIEKQTVPW